MLLLFLPLNLESFAYRHLLAIPVHLHRKLNEKIHRVMKIKNIFFAVMLVLAGFSCSMEDDTIMNDVEKGIEEVTDAYTVLDFNVAFNEMATKSTTVKPDTDIPATGDENNGEKNVSDVSVFLLEGGNIIGILQSDQPNQVSSDNKGIITLKDLKFVTKYKAGRTLEAHVVINGNEFLTGINIGDSKNVLDKTISGHLSDVALIKYGHRSIVLGTDVTDRDPSPAVAEANPTTILVQVSQVAARLDFSQFAVTLDGFANAPAVTLLEAKFMNIQENSTIFGAASDNGATGEVSAKIPTGANNTWSNIATTYSYANNVTALYVKFQVGDRTFEKTYLINPANIEKTINHNGIRGGYLYDIKVHWTITPKWGDSTIEFYTRDWVYNAIPEIEL